MPLFGGKKKKTKIDFSQAPIPKPRKKVIPKISKKLEAKADARNPLAPSASRGRRKKLLEDVFKSSRSTRRGR